MLITLITTVGIAACAFPVHGKPTTSAEPLVHELLPGIPNLPDLVTVVPFYTKPNETPQEQTMVVISAEVDGHRGIFTLDLGDDVMALNRTYLQPNESGGVDTITDANRTPDFTPRADYMTPENFSRFDRAHVTIRMGTLVSHFEDPALSKALGASEPHQYNVLLGHLWGDFGWGFAPKLGNIGPTALEPFETIVDYTHKRVVLIRLDSTGHRMAKVPAYTPRWTGPLINVPDWTEWFSGFHMLGINVEPGMILDTLDAANNTQLYFIDTGSPINAGNALGYQHVLGYPFLSQLGAFGINQRTHQFILYSSQ